MFYELNETMELIGRQSMESLMGTANEDFSNLLRAIFTEAQPAECIAMDAFLLGMVWGKRLDRARRKKSFTVPEK